MLDSTTDENNRTNFVYPEKPTARAIRYLIPVVVVIVFILLVLLPMFIISEKRAANELEAEQEDEEDEGEIEGSLNKDNGEVPNGTSTELGLSNGETSPLLGESDPDLYGAYGEPSPLSEKESNVPGEDNHIVPNEVSYSKSNRRKVRATTSHRLKHKKMTVSHKMSAHQQPATRTYPLGSRRLSQTGGIFYLKHTAHVIRQ
ncbi:hypothetical protein ACOME3_008626 [Neoechinorhynchus agilis]